MRTFTSLLVLCLCALSSLFLQSRAHQNVGNSWSWSGKELSTSAISVLRELTGRNGVRSLASFKRRSDIDESSAETGTPLKGDNVKLKSPKPLLTASKAALGRKSRMYHAPFGRGAESSPARLKALEKFASIGMTRQAPKPSPVVLPKTREDVAGVSRQTGESASPTPIPKVLYDTVLICKQRNPIWNVVMRNTMGELLVLAYPGSLAKAEAFARCIREDVASMKREEYLKFAMYNCVGTDFCSVSATGECSCTTGKQPDRCINVDFTRALIECKYGPGI